MSRPAPRLRRAVAADVGVLAHLEERGFDDPWDEGALACELGREDGLFLLAFDARNPSPAGYATWRRTLDEAELLRVAVAPELRRRGFGEELLRHGLEVLRGEGARVCCLEVRPDNRGARELYRKLGFRRLGSRPHYYPDGSPALIYSLDLQGPVPPP